jgi:hypothetical protein
MKVKTEHNLQPAERKAHTVIVEDDAGNPLFAATHFADGIVCASISDPDFKTVLQLVNDGAQPPKIIEIPT